MACKKYAGWVTDGALGQLPPWRQSELTAHVRDCAACREELERVRQAAELADRGMESLVEGEPSAQFGAGLRSRIAEESPTSTDLTRRLAIAASVALCLALFGTAAMRYLERSARPVQAPRVSAVSSGSVEHVRAGNRATAAVARPRAMQARLHRREAASVGSEVLVQPGQMAALDEFYEALRRQQAAGARAIALRDDGDQPMKIAPIAVKPLEVKPIKVPSVADFSGSWGGF